MRISVRTLGCKVNQVESDALVGLLSALRPQVVAAEDGPDLFVLNTCAVTTSADRTCRKEIRKARRLNPDAFVVVTGCHAELEGEQLKELGADVVVPNARKAELPGVILQRFGLPPDPVTTPPNEFWGAGERGLLTDRVRGFLKIQDGCNAGCAYCVIPKLRGRERHRAGDEAVAEARALLSRGIVEIVLTGVRLGSYQGHPGGVGGLIEALVAEGAAVRLSSIEPEDVGEPLLQVMARHAPRVRPHLHLSLQTGSSRLLELMGRRYDKAYYRRLVARARQLVPDFALTTDVIAGLPTETEQDHQETLAFLEEVRPSRIHPFTYTPRPGTRAARMAQVPKALRKRRNHDLTMLAHRLAAQQAAPKVGSTVTMLVERTRTRDGVLRARGHTPDYYEVAADVPTGTSVVQGRDVRVAVHGLDAYELRGTLLPA